MAMDGPSGMGTDGNVTCHLFTCVMVKSTNGDVMGTKSDTRPMHNLPTVATTARIHRSAICDMHLAGLTLAGATAMVCDGGRDARRVFGNQALGRGSSMSTEPRRG